ncbi:tetraacyldisaccharide 4'-kinase [Paraglaciecola marina]|uniref:tetraacyldisaccharide 4'-kinase n=1 Tax=Paraglaciecola marina TaxID=2500157 RepID=UPI001060BBCA|nr:tetraacyldisaccharide 4'-kinase [Paraglaciecola marina]
MSFIDKLWYSPSWYHWPFIILLLPLTLLFWGVSASRRFAFNTGVKKSTSVAAPVIVVGNISVGGNGKTPLVVYLAKRLRQEGYHPGVLSRGYGAKQTSFPHFVTASCTAHQVGDEPVLMRQHINCPLVIDPIRARGANKLVDDHKCNVIICDDGLQHYALVRDIEIVVMDGQRLTGNGCLLPSGPLREGLWRLKSVDFVVLNGGLANNGEYLMALESGRLVNVSNPNKSLSIHDISQDVTAIAAIGNPQRFFTMLEQKQVKLKTCTSFVDHHQFTVKDIPSGTVIMTEKDAVKCREFAHKDCWYLPVNAHLPQQFDTKLIQNLKQVSENKKRLSK